MTPHHYDNPQTAAFRATLDLLPDEIALAIGLRVYDDDTLGDIECCVCGWAIREAIAREVGKAADDVGPDETNNVCTELAARFGVDYAAWNAIFLGVCSPLAAPLIEEALFDRVMAAAEASV